MQILWHYLKPYKGLVAFSLLLAAINQTFSLFDPWIFGKMIDKFANHASDFTENAFIWGVVGYLGLLVGTAMVSRETHTSLSRGSRISMLHTWLRAPM